MKRCVEAGAALLEAMVSLAIIAASGVSAVTALDAALDSEWRLRNEELSLNRADRLLTAAALLGREDLDRRLGRHPVGDFVMEVQRPERVLYRISLSEVARPEREVLVTVVYRPEQVQP